MISGPRDMLCQVSAGYRKCIEPGRIPWICLKKTPTSVSLVVSYRDVKLWLHPNLASLTIYNMACWLAYPKPVTQADDDGTDVPTSTMDKHSIGYMEFDPNTWWRKIHWFVSISLWGKRHARIFPSPHESITSWNLRSSNGCACRSNCILLGASGIWLRMKLRKLRQCRGETNQKGGVYFGI